MKNYTSTFQDIHIDESLKLLQKKWTGATADMSEETFKSEVEKIAQLAEQYHIEKFHDDTTNFYFVIMPRLQTWVNEQIFPRFINAGLRKYAIVVSEEMIAQLSIEQTMEEDNTNNFQVCYFDSAEKAKKWLLS